MDARYYMYMSMGSQASILNVFRTFCLHFCHTSARAGHCCASREPDTQPLPIPVTKKKKIMSPMPPTIKPGTKKDQAQGELGVVAQNEGIIAPRMFPIAVRDVHTPSRVLGWREVKQRKRNTTSLLLVPHSARKRETLHVCMSRKGEIWSH